ncbi:MAG: hypothetical protein EXS42_02850 [Lacunisphaera sp.]|nr:hypothetical protein [Lacunisphaera sp.]
MTRFLEMDGWGITAVDASGIRAHPDRIAGLIIAITDGTAPDAREIFEGREDFWRKLGENYGLKRLKNGYVVMISDPLWPEQVGIEQMVNFSQSQFGDKGVEIARQAYEHKKQFAESCKKPGLAMRSQSRCPISVSWVRRAF